MSVMAVISVGLLLLSGYVWYTFRNIDGGVTRYKIAVGTGAQNNGRNIDGQDQNILLVGNDDRSTMSNSEMRQLHAGRDGGSLATDTMMIVHVPANGKKATLISLPRDTYVKIAGHGMGKLNSAYADAYTTNGGSQNSKRLAAANMLLSTISTLTGLTIDHYIQVDLLGFYRISNAIGGVPVTLCSNVDDSLAANRQAGLPGGSGLKLSKGKHIIKGVQALEFVRQRHFLPRGDLDRVRRQQYFLTAAFRQVASVGVVLKLRTLGSAVQRSVFLDQNLKLIDLAQQMEKLSANNIVGKTIPTSPGKSTDGQDILVAKPSKVKAFVDTVINGPAKPTPGSSSSSKSSSTTPTATTTKPVDSKCIN